MPWWIIVALVAVVIASNYFAIKAMRRLSPAGHDRRWRIYLWSKLFAGRENFTEEGWRYRNIAWACLAVWPIMCLVWLVTS